MLIRAAESGWLPDPLIRHGIRRLCKKRLALEHANDTERWRAVHEQRLEAMNHGPIAVETDAANDQHYELPESFFGLVLGKRRKYSCCLFEHPESTLDEAEEASLAQIGERAQLANGHSILELGCGWGSLTLWMAEHYPDATITAVSNSATQREYITATALSRGLTNVTVTTANIEKFEPQAAFDRIVSVEMFEHVRNHAELMRRASQWLNAAGKLFVHVFCHRHLLYPFEVDGDDDWMARYFFSGGVMPSFEMLTRHQEHLELEEAWRVSGRHYEQTANAWLANLDQREPEVRAILAAHYGDQAGRWVGRWRMFFMACAELFGYDQGRQWHVAHYRFVKNG